ncbi:hypothetical protein ACFV0R_07910 [Streptomyces sp. NPDC059578]|uniref:hypothetical protein n=1 Tax=unclassified Streptomyces TaxID=2593676 RepID=UPI0036488B01
MNVAEPVSALFPGASGRIVTALARHRRADGAHLTLTELARASSVVASQLEAVLFRLGLLGLLHPRARGEDVRIATGHLVWGALDGLLDLGPALRDRVRARALRDLDPAPRYLGISGAVADGTASGPSDTLHLTVTAPAPVPDGWVGALEELVRGLATDLGNIVTYDVTDEPAAGPPPGTVTVLDVER